MLIIALGQTAARAQSKRLDEVTVVSRRPVAEIGVTKTAVDSSALRQNIALSMADVLSFNTPVFVKSSGRATLSTVSFRGTAPSHTSVSWNGLPINSPALGMTDFSLIPAYFVDRAALLHGASSMAETSGGLGGMVNLSTSEADIADGLSMQYVQGVGSFTTLDQFLRIGYGGEKWKSQTRAVYSFSKNDFRFTNTDRYVYTYNPDGSIASRRHPRDRNLNGKYGDFHLLQQLYYRPAPADRLGLNAWITLSDRNIAPLMANYGTRDYRNNQSEDAARVAARWTHSGRRWRLDLNAGYIYSRTAYDYGPRLEDGDFDLITRSRTYVNSLIGGAKFKWNCAANLFFDATLNSEHNRVSTRDLASLNSSVGFSQSRTDTDLSASLRWQPSSRLGLSATLREDVIGSEINAPIGAVFADFVIFTPVNLTLKGSAARNFHAPSLNDLYFQPGGNPALKSENGWSGDLGLEASATSGKVTWNGGATWFDSRIDDWILWLPTIKGFFSPRNVKAVHSYGVELKAGVGLQPFRDAALNLRGAFSWTRSVNVSPPLNQYDASVGKQLPYVPEYTSSLTAMLSWRRWAVSYKLCYYSKRYTMSSNEDAISGSLPDYVMSNVDLERKLSFRPADLSVKLSVNNLFNSTYQSIMGRPMPGLNFELFLSLTPKFP